MTFKLIYNGTFYGHVFINAQDLASDYVSFNDAYYLKTDAKAKFVPMIEF